MRKLSGILVAVICTTLVLMASPGFAYQKELRNPENMTEWLVEGEVNLRSGKEKESAFFTWTQIGTAYQLELRKNNMAGEVFAKAEGELWQGPESIGISGDHELILETLKQNSLFTSMAFWLRALPEDDSSTIAKEKNGQLMSLYSSVIKNRQWIVEFKNYLEFNNYPFPGDITIESEDTRITIDILRAETGFITADYISHHAMVQECAPDTEEPAMMPNANQNDDERFIKEQQSRKESPYKWVNSKDFCEQLVKIHGETVNSKHGLFGPDSMMWELNRYFLPAGFGAGRALLLQIAHPWVTAGIDEHSEVRNDPIERGRRTFVYMYTIIYGSLPQAMNAAYEVHQIHEQIRGHLPYEARPFEKGSEYRANEIEAMIWVHATLWDTLVLTYEKIERKLSVEEKEKFYEETKLFAMMFGIPKEALPASWHEFERYNQYMWRRLEVSDAAKRLADDLFRQKNPLLMVLMPIQKNFTKATLPPRVREQYDMDIGWFGKSFYKSAVLSAKIGDRLLIPPLRYNPVYREAKARVEGRKSGILIRSALKSSVGKSVLVN